MSNCTQRLRVLVLPEPRSLDPDLELEGVTLSILKDLREEIRLIDGCYRSLADGWSGDLVPPVPQAEL